MKGTWIASLVTFAIAVLPSGAAAAGFPPPYGYGLADGTNARAMTAGPDGNVWFVGEKYGSGGSVAGKVTPEGKVTEYQLPVRGGARSIVSGPDGSLWFVADKANAIGRITTDGDATSFLLPRPKSRPSSIALGPDGNLWFTEEATSAIGRVTPSGEIAEFSLPPGRQPSDIAAGPDGRLWFTERGVNRIGRITTAGQVTHFPVPGPWAKLSSIDLGPDGNLWFTEEAAPRIGRITPRGRVTQFTVPLGEPAETIVSGPGQLLWFTSGPEIGAIDTSGAISWPACLTDYCGVLATALTMGPEGSLWVGADYEICTYCGGGGAIEYLSRPGGVGKFELPPLAVGIGPRAAPVRGRETSVTVACGMANGCRGWLRLGLVEGSGDDRRYQTVAKGSYDLAAGQAERVRLRLSRKALGELRKADGAYPVEARAGPPGQVQAQRGISLVMP